ncbi:MAG: RNA polymerase subunit sigma-24 [Chlorobiaceae bacterium]|nr:RNA polymerase subunit sigma-24 [Chlorobiaceae bacterium]
MEKKNRTPLQLIDDIYSLGYWITGSKEDAVDLFEKTYLLIDPEAPELEVFKAFRHCLLESYSGMSCIPQPSCKAMEKLGSSLVKQDAEVKLTVLLSEISGLSATDIAAIIGQSVKTVNLWLTAGRKRFASELVLLDGNPKRSPS